MGITMEGIHQNEVVYELALDMRWLAKQSVQFLHSGNVKEYIDDWLMQFVRQRLLFHLFHNRDTPFHYFSYL